MSLLELYFGGRRIAAAPEAAQRSGHHLRHSVKKMQDKELSSGVARLLQHWPVGSVFALCLSLTIAGFFFYKHDTRIKSLDRATRKAVEYQRTLEDGIRGYVQLNRDITGFFAASGDVTAREFNEFMETVSALESHPGLEYIRYIPRVALDDAAAFESKTREVLPLFEFRGSHADPDFVYPALFSYPEDENSKKVSGYDYSGNAERWDAMRKARDWGKSIATKKSDDLSNTRIKNIIVIFTPIYANGKALDTIPQRRIAHIGFVASIFSIHQAIDRIMGPDFKALFDLEIFNGEIRRENLLYDGDGSAHTLMGEAAAYPLAHHQDMKFAGKTWSLYFYPTPAYFAENERPSSGWLILFSGSLVSIVAAFLAWEWQRRREVKRLQLEHAQRFQSVFENHPFAVFSLDLQRCFNSVNTKTTELLEAAGQEVIGVPFSQFIAPVNKIKTNQLFQQVAQGNAVSYDDALITRKGKLVDVSIVVIPVSIEGQITGYLGIAQNITERRQAERALWESRNMLQLVIENIPQRVFWKDVNSIFLGCNKAVCQDAGLSEPQEIVGKSDYDFAWAVEADTYRKDDWETMQSGIPKINFEEVQHRPDGSQYWLRTSKIPLTNAEGEAVGILGTYEDITERKLLEQKLEQMAHYDSLSGLPNRAFFYEQLQLAVNRSKRHGTVLAAMYFDIDKFKLINDTYGHDVGDAVIVRFARRIKAAIRETDIVGRLGGDEFCLIIDDLTSRESAPTIAEKVIEAMQPAFQIGDRALQVSTSIGIAFYEPGMATDELLHRADQAMYQAKQTGRNRFEIDSV